MKNITNTVIGERLFSFALITDTHLNQGEDDCNSPFAVNRLANRRLRYIIHELNQRELDFVIHIGDLIHPVPAIPTLYQQAAARFQEQIKTLKHPLHLVSGNHDIGDKPNEWAPAASICDEYIALWEQHFGAHYYAFEHADCCFIIINAQLLNSGLSSEAQQRDWLEQTLETHRHQRLFLNSHYPPYLLHTDETANYDNISEPGRSWLLNLLEQYSIEALFCGHVHNFWYNRYAGTDCYLLPSTAFVRQDYSEMYRIPPGPEDEAGRNDKAKLGYFIVHIHEHGHYCEIIRSYGETLEINTPKPAVVQRLTPVHPRLNRHAVLGFDMRQNWLETIEVPPTGGLDEFERKQVRNDYPLMALWEMGVGKLRVPMNDLWFAERRERMRILKQHGHEFTLFSFQLPDARSQQLLQTHHDIFSAWEIAINWDNLDTIIEPLSALAEQIKIPIYLSRLRTIDELRSEAGQYYHVINQGFLATDREQLQALFQRPNVNKVLAGCVFRVTADTAPWPAIQAIGELTGELGIKASIHVRMCDANPAVAVQDDRWLTQRIAESIWAACGWDNLSVFIDTFADSDRGYLVRNGVLDRLYNPKPAFHLIRHLLAALNQDSGPYRQGLSGNIDGARYITLDGNEQSLTLILPDSSQAQIDIPSPTGVEVQQIDLISGTIKSIAVTANAAAVPIQIMDNDPILLQFDKTSLLITDTK